MLEGVEVKLAHGYRKETPGANPLIKFATVAGVAPSIRSPNNIHYYRDTYTPRTPRLFFSPTLVCPLPHLIMSLVMHHFIIARGGISPA